MKLPRWSGLALLLLHLSCVSLPKMSAQQGGAEVAPPQAMRVCINASPVGCENLTWTGELYEGRADNSKEISSRYWVNEWTSARIDLTIKSRKGGDGVFPLDGKMTGAMPVLGGHGVSGTLNWQIGYSKSGATTFVLTWPKTAPSTAAVSGPPVYTPARQSRTHPEITLPPGAAEAFAGYPDVVRAILLPEYALPLTDAKRPCRDASVRDANTALEIARFAYRAADMARGNCWIYAAQGLGSTRAKVISATTFLYGWTGTPKDETKGFGMLKTLLSTRDPWDIWILNQCYIDGTGTPKDAHQAAILASYALTHDDVYQVSQLVGSDNAALVRQFGRLQVLMDPPMKSSTSCRAAGPMETHSAGYSNGQICTTTTVVDNDRLQRKLADIDNQH